MFQNINKRKLTIDISNHKLCKYLKITPVHDEATFFIKIFHKKLFHYYSSFHIKHCPFQSDLIGLIFYKLLKLY